MIFVVRYLYMKKFVFIIVILVAVAGIWFLSSWLSEDSLGKNYVGYGEECSRIQVLCVEGYERFDDEKGCGCKPTQ